MRWILDSCTLIYLVKTKMFKNFVECVQYPVIIDTSVFQEVIVEGKVRNHLDAIEAEKLLNKYRIPVIPLDIESELFRMKNAGETSCLLLAKEEGICITSDRRAYNKFKRERIEVIKIERIYFELYKKQKISKIEFIEILKKFEEIHAIKPKILLKYIERIKNLEED